MKRWLKTFLILVAFFLLPALWLLISHARAKHALERYEAQLRADGEKLTIDELLPPRVPSEQNGAKLLLQASPYIRDEGVLSSNPPPAMAIMAPGKAMIGWQQPYIVNARGNWPMTNTWEDVGQDLKQQLPDLNSLHQAATFSGLDFGVDYHEIPPLIVPSLDKIQPAGALLSYATVFDLHHGATPSAVTNVHTALSLVDKWDERLLISQLLRFGVAAVCSSAQWEVLQSTNLSDSELAMLQHDWESMEFVQPMENAFNMERVLCLAVADQLRTSNSPSASIASNMGRYPSSGLGSSSGMFYFIKNLGQATSRKTSDTLWRISWSYDDQLRTLQGFQVAAETVRQIETNGFFDNALAEQDRKFKALGLKNRTNDWLRTHFNYSIMLEYYFGGDPANIGRAFNRLLRAESIRRITVTAIALKRYQLRHGTRPVNLDALAPEFLSEIPRDPADGSPLQYQSSPDGTFTLYSAIWVWPQPATPEEIQQYYTNLLQRTSVYK